MEEAALDPTSKPAAPRHRRPALIAATAVAGLLANACSSSTPAAFTASGSAACSSSAPGGVLTAACDTTSPPASLTGAGASSIGPFFTQAFYDYAKANPGVQVNYNPAGSSVGVTDLQQGTVQFGDSEVPVPVPTTGSGGTILQVPVGLGGVALIYHVPGAPQGLKLDGAVLAGIFLGTVTNWNAQAIASLNPGVTLADLPIVAVHRADSSGPGYDLDQYLIDAGGPAWTTIATTRPSTHWPAANIGVGQQLNTGVASYIKQTAGAIGYVEFAYAQQAGLHNAALENAAGTYVAPSAASITAAGAQATSLSAGNFNIVNQPGAATYPLANFSWTLVDETQPSTSTGIVLGKLLDWVTMTGQQQATALGYSPLPANAVALAHQTLETLQTAGGQPIFAPAP